MSRRKTQGAGHVPAPRGMDEETALAVIAELRAELREARGALSDLVRERKAVEELARSHALRVIEEHVNVQLQELTKHVDKTNKGISEQLTRYHKAHLDHLIKDWMGLVDAQDLVYAVSTLRQLQDTAQELARQLADRVIKESSDG